MKLPYIAPSTASLSPTTATAPAFDAAAWHRNRRRAILTSHPEVKALTQESDFWTLSLGGALLPLFGLALLHAPDASAAELLFNAWGIGSLRANWAIYCSHALSHGRWAKQVGRTGTARFNAALAFVNVGTCFQILPGYWLMHASHHTRLGSLPLLEARQRAKKARPTDGDLGLATRLFSPPSRKYSLVLDATSGEILPRQDELVHQLLNVVLHGIAPIGLAGYLVAALKADDEGTTPAAGEATMRTNLAIQAAASLLGYLTVAGISAASHSANPLLLYLGTSVVWLSPFNANWIWTCPHVCTPKGKSEEEEEPQPTVSFYTPPTALGALLDGYMGWENYHVEHHDFPEVPMYLLPKLRRIAPEMYEDLKSYPVLEKESWQALWSREYFYACQDRRFQRSVGDYDV